MKPVRVTAVVLVALLVVVVFSPASWWQRAPAPTPTAPEDLLGWIRGHVTFYRMHLLFAFANKPAISMTVNWLLWLHHIGISPRMPLILCADGPTYDYFASQNLTAYLLTEADWRAVDWLASVPPDATGTTALFKWRSVGYNLVMHAKMVFALHFLQAGFPIAYLDTDVAYPRTKPHAIDVAIDVLRGQPPSVGMVAQDDGQDDPGFCMGFFLALPLPETIDLLVEVKAEMRSNTALDDQDLFNQVVRRSRSSSVVALDRRTFVVGRHIFLDGANSPYRSLARAGWPAQQQHKFPHMIHANYLIGEAKYAKLREFNLWLADDPARRVAAGLVTAPPS
jgi:hypothetical protein